MTMSPGSRGARPEAEVGGRGQSTKGRELPGGQSKQP